MTAAVPTTAPYAGLLRALEDLRSKADQLPLPLEVPGVEAGRKAQRELVAQLDDYVLPRLRRLDAPLLVVVGGSTGAGKSTLVNSIVGHQVTRPGVLRPTTRAPVLVHHPDDARWFSEQRVLPGLARVTGASAEQREQKTAALGLVGTAAVPPGLALLDAPDIDSVVTANRELAAQLLAAADLWVFVTTAARYADAVPWDLLRTATERGTALAVVLDRVPPAAVAEVREHLAGMLHAQGLGGSPLFAVEESPLQHGLLPDAIVAPVRDWLRALAADAPSRAAVIRMTLDGALDSLPARVGGLAERAHEQAVAAALLREEVRTSYAAAVREVDEAMTDGSLLRGEVLARWQEYVGTGELLRALENRVGRLRDRLTATLRGRPQPVEEITVALESGLESLVGSAADAAAERSADAWSGRPAGAALLARSDTDLAAASANLPERARRTVRDWQGGVLDLVRREGQGKRSTARFLAYGVNGIALLVMIAVFASSAGLTGTEVAVAGGASALSQKLLEAVLGDQAVRTLATRARADLHERVEALLAEEQARFTALLDVADVRPNAPQELRAAVRHLQAARDAEPGGAPA
jgi:hypothetical protein